MSAPLFLVSGTGTGIGKTHFTAALLRALARSLEELGIRPAKVAGLKPIESGITEGTLSDVETLGQASTFHVKHPSPPYMLGCPVSPHLAAAMEGRKIELEPILAYVATARRDVDAMAVELPGGLFSPLAPELCNADVALALAPTALLLVAPDRLGVLHEVAATTRAATAMGLPLSGLVLVAPERPDASTGTNARELAVVCTVPVLAVLPRATVEELARREDLLAVARSLLRETDTRG